MKSINVFGDIHPELWERQKLSETMDEYRFHYKDFSKNSSWSVHIGNAKVKFHPRANSKNIFMLAEPPDIYKYKSKDLASFDIVSGPKFPEYMNLPNYVFSQVALPWSIGISYPEIKKSVNLRLLNKIIGNSEVLRRKNIQINFNVQELLELTLDKEKSLSIVTSNKIETPMQKRRLDFIKFLTSRNKIPIDVYGRGFRSINDKFEILKNSSHHLALENSSYDGYWTEKLADAILSLNRTYYAGATDVNRYFPSDVVLRLDLSDFESAANTIEDDFINQPYNRISLENARIKLVKENSFESIVLTIIQNYTETALVK